MGEEPLGHRISRGRGTLGDGINRWQEKVGDVDESQTSARNSWSGSFALGKSVG
jgi:hypothetical protein